MSNPRYRGTLPLLNWLHKNYPSAAHGVAGALIDQKQAAVEPADELDREIRPTVGELMRAASDAFRFYVRDGIPHVAKAALLVGGKDYRDDWWFYLGDLVFHRGRLIEWGKTKKGKTLRPRDEIRGDGKHKRNPSRYLAKPAAIPAPMDVESLRRPMSGEPALPDMYDPLDGVEDARAILAAAYARGSPPVTRCPTVPAAGAYFFGGIIRPKAGANAGTVGVWKAPSSHQGNDAEVLDEVAAGGTLKSLGTRLGYGPQYADRAAKKVLIELGNKLAAANDNKKSKTLAA